MELNVDIIKKVIIVIAAIIVLLLSKFYFHMSEGNPIEVVAEEVIEQETGEDISGAVAKL